MRIIKNEKLFNLLSWTWGLPLTLIGYIVTSIFKAMGYKVEKFGYCHCVTYGHNWGGVSFGPFMIVCEEAQEHTKAHEHGHAIQNCWLGFLAPFVVNIPSAVRYWHRMALLKQGKIEEYKKLPDYDSAWFEYSATNLGTEFIAWYNENKK